MEKISLMLFTFLIASCVTVDRSFSQQKEHNLETLALSYYGARNDLKESDSVKLETNIKINETPPESFKLVNLPLTYAIYCDEEKIDCRHAAVKSTLKFTVHVSGAGQKEIRGHLFSEMGRSVSLTVSSGQYSTLSVPENVSLIEGNSSKSPFKMAILVGNTLEIKGIAGDKVILEIQ